MTNARPARLGVVLYRNTRAELERLTRSLAAADGAVASDVAFLDNSPGEELREVVGELAPAARYAHAGRNLGFGAAHNRLMAAAFAGDAAYYVCVNPDAILHPRCLAELVLEAGRARRAGLVEALQCPDEHPKPYDPATHETPWCSGCVLLVTRELWSAIGGFDERFFMYCEDVDLSWRARAAGFSTTVAPRALVHHYVGDRPDGGALERMFESGALLGAKYGSGSFARECLRLYRERSGRAGPAPAVARPRREWADVADFAHGLYFARPRW
jgi:GT2 family glycosyltransferase